mmetsp:Transcript_27819/g.80187  ORF Transcript_27819/g.80187 Transcript_27819/m.80187 type:complete len:86 (-) Transcript_27819:2-259(-)
MAYGVTGQLKEETKQVKQVDCPMLTGAAPEGEPLRRGGGEAAAAGAAGEGSAEAAKPLERVPALGEIPVFSSFECSTWVGQLMVN